MLFLGTDSSMTNCMPTVYLFQGLAGFVWHIGDFPHEDDRVSHACCDLILCANKSVFETSQ